MSETTTPPQTIRIPLELSRYAKAGHPSDQGHYVSPYVLAHSGRGRAGSRYRLGFVSAEGTCRRTHGGEVLPGPHAYAYGLSSVIDNHGGTGAEIARNKAAGLEHTVVDGDILDFDGVLFTVGQDFTGHLTLTEVGP